MSDLSQETALELARECAYLHTGDHSYLPTTREEAEAFEPHPWALSAIKAAYQLGRQDEQKAAGPRDRASLW